MNDYLIANTDQLVDLLFQCSYSYLKLSIWSIISDNQSTTQLLKWNSLRHVLFMPIFIFVITRQQQSFYGLVPAGHLQNSLSEIQNLVLTPDNLDVSDNNINHEEDFDQGTV